MIMAVVNDIGLHPIIRELALKDPDLFSQIQRIHLFQEPLANGILVQDVDRLYYAFGFEDRETFGFKFDTNDPIAQRRLSEPRHIYCLNKRTIVTIAYDLHVLILTEDGIVWGWGNNTGFPLGQHERMLNDTYSEPILVTSDAAKIAAGRYHSLFVDSEGHVFCVGDNHRGQTHPDLTVKSLSVVLQNKEIRDQVKEVYCTTHLSMALTHTDVLYIWGQIGHRIINIVLGLERYGTVKKLVIVEFPLNDGNMYDVKILILTEQKELYRMVYFPENHRFVAMKLATPGNIVDIIGGVDGCYALVDENQKMTMYDPDIDSAINHRIHTRIKSHIDAAMLYGLPLKFAFCELSTLAEQMSIIQKLDKFNFGTQTDFEVKWQGNIFPGLRLKRSVFFEHLPHLMGEVLGDEFVWPDQPNKKPYGGLEPYRFKDKIQPFYTTMYAYLVFVHVQRLPAGISVNLDEFYYLGNYFNDERFKQAFPSRYQLSLKVVRVPEFSPPKPDKLNLELLQRKKIKYSRHQDLVFANTDPEPVPLLDLPPMSEEEIIKKYRTDCSEAPILFSKNPILITEHLNQMGGQSERNETIPIVTSLSPRIRWTRNKLTRNMAAQNRLTTSIVEVTQPVAEPSRMATASEVAETTASIANTLSYLTLIGPNQSIDQSTSAIEQANEDSLETSVQSEQAEPEPESNIEISYVHPLSIKLPLCEIYVDPIAILSQLNDARPVSTNDENAPSTSGVSQIQVDFNAPSTSSSTIGSRPTSQIPVDRNAPSASSSESNIEIINVHLQPIESPLNETRYVNPIAILTRLDDARPVSTEIAKKPSKKFLQYGPLNNNDENAPSTSGVSQIPVDRNAPSTSSSTIGSQPSSQMTANKSKNAESRKRTQMTDDDDEKKKKMMMMKKKEEKTNKPKRDG